MGKGLIIQGADFSANGVKVESVLGEQVKTNTYPSALNVIVKQTWLSTLGIESGTVKILLSSTSSVVNTQLNGETIAVQKYISGYSPIGTFKWGEPFSFEYPITDLVEIAFQSNTVYSNMDDKDIIIQVIQ